MDPKIREILYRHAYWEKGIPSWMYRRERSRDVHEIMSVEAAKSERRAWEQRKADAKADAMKRMM